MKLYVVFWLNPGHDPNCFQGIYSTQEKADAAIAKLEAETGDSGGYDVSEVELDADPEDADPRAVRE